MPTLTGEIINGSSDTIHSACRFLGRGRRRQRHRDPRQRQPYAAHRRRQQRRDSRHQLQIDRRGQRDRLPSTASTTPITAISAISTATRRRRHRRPISGWRRSGDDCPDGDDPIILNLDGGAVQTQGLETSTAFFDMQNDGEKVHTGWVTAGEGLLVYDPDGSNSVTGDRDLVAGFDALKELAGEVDGASSGTLSASDALWSKLKVWVDTTGTGDFHSDQLYTLGQLGITSINLNAANVERNSNGNTILADSSFTRSDGSSGDIAGVALRFASGRRRRNSRGAVAAVDLRHGGLCRSGRRGIADDRRQPEQPADHAGGGPTLKLAAVIASQRVAQRAPETAKQSSGAKNWIASSQVLLAMTARPCDIYSRDIAAVPSDIAASDCRGAARWTRCLINTTTAGDQDQPGVAGLRGTQFAVVWADHGSGNIRGQMLGVNAAPSDNEFIVNFPQAPGTKRQLPAIIEIGRRPCRRMDRAAAGRAGAAQASHTRGGYAVGTRKPGLDRGGRAADTAGAGAAAGRRLRRGLGRQARGRAHPRAALQSRRHEKRSGVSRQYRPRPAPGPDGRRVDERKHRHRMAGALSLASARSLADFRCERAGRRRADHGAEYNGGRHRRAGYRPLRHRGCQERARWRGRLRHHRRPGERVRGQWRVRQYPLCSHEHWPDPVLLADARAVARRTLSAGLDRGQCR